MKEKAPLNLYQENNGRHDIPLKSVTSKECCQSSNLNVRISMKQQEEKKNNSQGDRYTCRKSNNQPR